MLLEDKVVIVSGIGPGLGIELSTLAAIQGARLVVAARTPAKLEQAEAAIRERGLTTEVIRQPTDITDPDQCQRLVDRALEEFGRVDALINSAYSPGRFTSIMEADFDDWRQTLNTNLIGTMQLSVAAARPMKEQGGGAIVMINSQVTRKPMPAQAGYAASKGALSAATKHLAQELGPWGIRVNSAYMGWMWGPPVEGFMQHTAPAQGTTVAEMRKQVAQNIPLGDIPEDGDCAKVAIFLASDYGCAMTGANVDVNGGEYMPA